MRIFGQKREDVTEELEKIHKEKLHNLYASYNVIKVIKYGG
jgi:hypothetical protein